MKSPKGSPLFPWGFDEFHALWLGLTIVELLLSVSWQVSVSGVVNILGGVEGGWEVELVELLRREVDVVLNTITIGIVDLVGVKSPLSTGLEEVVLIHVLRAGQDHTPVAEVLLGLDELLFGGFESFLFLGLGLSLLLGFSGFGFSVWVSSWLWVLSPSNVAWELSVSSVMEILNGWREDHLSELVEGILIVLDVVLNTITIGIDDSSWLVWSNSDSRGVDVRILLWDVGSI